jgi:hypothetical protein
MPQSYPNTAYLFQQSPLGGFEPLPIIAKRAPTVNDKNYQIGQLWVYSASNAAYILTSVVANVATWTSLTSGSASTVGSLTITGASPNLIINSMTTPGVLVNSSTGSVTSQALTNGQLLIGSTGLAPVASTLTAGPGITITNGAGSITISEAAGGFTWSSKAANFNAVAGNGYVITAGSGSVTATLPAAAALGDTIDVLYPSATASDIMIISKGAGTSIRVPGNSSTAGGLLTFPDCSLSGSAHPSVQVICVNSTGPVWQVTELDGNPTLS